jgi:protein NrfC
LSLARIQVVQNPFTCFPNDINITQCSQCVKSACLAACPVGAIDVDVSNGNVRTVDKEKCIGCNSCDGEGYVCALIIG